MPTITGIAYADLLVRRVSVDRWLAAWTSLGFEPAGQVHTPETDGYPLRHPDGGQLIVSAARPGSPAETDLDRYGEGIRDLALFTDDVPGTYTAMTGAGAAPISGPGWTLDGSPAAAAGGVGRLRHTLLQTPAAQPAGFDHIGIVVPAGELPGAAGFYARAGFMWAPAAPAGTRRDGTVSGVLTAGAAALTLTAPNPRSNQLGPFLAASSGAAAVQHLAVPARIDQLTDTDLARWAVAPPGWAQDLKPRPDMRLLTGRGMIAGRDSAGRLLRQCFTGPLAGSGLYAEFIQRRGNAGGQAAEGFGWDTADQLLAATPGRSPV